MSLEWVLIDINCVLFNAGDSGTGPGIRRGRWLRALWGDVGTMWLQPENTEAHKQSVTCSWKEVLWKAITDVDT